MTDWVPTLVSIQGPRYLAFVLALEADIASGRVKPGMRLLPQRDRAQRLDLSVGTISKAYAEAEQRGLISGEVGRGTFVQRRRPEARGHGTSETTINLALNVPPYTGEDDVIASAVLGDFHASPERLPANKEESAHWYRHAAELGHPGSAHILARALWAGVEGEPDPQEVAAWLETAIERGDPTAWPDLGGLIASLSLPPDHQILPTTKNCYWIPHSH